MFAHKLVALIDRYEKNGTIAGRDMYDIHHFFQKGYSYSHEIIQERRKSDVSIFLKQLIFLELDEDRHYRRFWFR